MASPDVAAILRLLESSRATGTLTLSSGEIDVDAGRPVGAWSGPATGREALALLKASDPGSFSFTARAARAANIEPEPDARGVRASLSLLSGRTIAGLDVAREQLLRRNVFGTKTPTLLDEPPAAANVWKPKELTSLANALITEYASATYGGRLWNDDIAARFSAAGAAPIPPLRVDRGRIDPMAVGERTDLDELVPFLRRLLRAIHADATRSAGEGAARRGYRTAVSRLWGAHERVLAAAMRVIEEKPPEPARLVATKTLAGSFPLLEREYVLGRASASDIFLAHPSVSRRHARIAPKGGVHVLTDTESTSGTLLNGTKIDAEHPLRAGDTLKLGDVELKYEGA
ncbi:MAG TPA: FHA domain-containing protein [Methylomirabilota bacterium]|nr:FHA domain-containing protein [Methylomirabilota bacterium]